MLMISGLRGANRMGFERMARTVGLDMISVIAILVVAFGYDNYVAVGRRWSVVHKVPWLAEEDEMVPRASTLEYEGGVVGQMLDPETTARSSSSNVHSRCAKVRAFEV